MSSVVHIVISDRGWILEKLAEEIKSRLPYVTYDVVPDADALIQYYMTYGTYRGRISPHEISLFTHLEEQPAAAQKFFETAAAMDVCVAMSLATEDLLVGKASRTTTISPGVDLDRFSPKLRIGVVGRTYHTGRKGEDLVAAVQDLPDIEWVFTGEGWPAPAQPVPEDELPAFYRSLDYVLVPARIEGGPMCVLEALACGVEVIAPPVGWVPQFPHLEFRTGDAQDLRRVLTEVIEKRRTLRRSVESYTWDDWAAKHHALFVSMVGEEALGQEVSPVVAPDMRAVVAVHGVEMSASAGGPSIRAPMTARALEKVGVDAAFGHAAACDLEEPDVVHILNVWDPDDCELAIQRAKKAAKPVVLSPIFLDLSEHDIYSRLIPEIFKHGVDERIVLPAYAAVRAQLKARRAEAMPSYEIKAGYLRQVQGLIAQADHVIMLSEDERTKLRRIGAEPDPAASSIVHNPVVATNFRNASPEIFEKEYGLKDYVLVVGRLESRKNQLTLAFALRSSPYPLVFIGHNTDASYLKLLKAVAGPNAHFIGRLEPNSEILASAFAGARVFCLPSWSEGAPLAALEAGAAGCRMILSDRSSEREYFGDHAWYCDPADPVGMRDLVVRAYKEERSEADRAVLKEYVRASFGWDRYTRGTRAAYEAAIRAHAASAAVKAPGDAQSGRILIDLTTLAHRDGPPSGIARAEDRLAVELHNLYPDQVRFFVWNSNYQCFLPVSRDVLDSGNIKQFRGVHSSIDMRQPSSHVAFDQMDFLPGDTIVVFGGAWIRNQNYLRDLHYVKMACDVRLVSTVYDVIQYKFMNWFPDGVGGEFARNCKILLGFSDRVLTCSQKSKDDIIEFAAAQKVALPPVDVFRLGDDAESIDPDAMLQLDLIATILGSRAFVLYVSAIDVRKNHRLLLDVWERLVQKHGGKLPKLILVGSKGWGGDVVINTLNASETLKQNVHILHGINDVTLQWLYSNCLFTVYPSLYEGWGLPVAESLSLGKFCIASNAGSLPEIAPSITDLIDPQDFMGWCERIERYVFRPSLLQAREEQARTYRRHSWTETAKFIAGQLKRVHATEELPELPVASKVSFATVAGAVAGTSLRDRITVGGWGRQEPKGSWTIGTSAALCFRLDVDGPTGLALLASAIMPKGCGPQLVDVMLNGVVVAVWRVDERVRWFVATLQPELFESTGKTVVRFNIRDPRVPAQYDSATTDRRPLGLFVQSLMIEPILTLAVNRWAEIVPDGARDVLVAFDARTERGKYLVMRLNAGAAGLVEIGTNDQNLAKIPVTPGEQIRIVRMEVLEQRAPELAMLAIRSPEAANIRILDIGIFTVVPSEIVERLQLAHGGRVAGDALAHPVWHGPPAAVPLDVAIQTVQDAPVVTGMVGGWHGPEPSGTWSNGSACSLHLAVPPVEADSLLIEMTVVPYEWHFAASEEIALSVLVGTCPLKTFRRSAPGFWTVSFRVPAERALDANRVLQITLRGMAGLVPARLGERDTRALSFMLKNVAVRPMHTIEVKPGSSVVVGQASRALLLENWHEPEPEWAWSPGGTAATLQLPVPDLPETAEDIQLGLDLDVYGGLTARGPCTLRFLAGDAEIATDVRTEPGIARVELRVPRAAVDPARSLCVLAIHAPEGISPQDAGESPDPRPLSFCVIALHYADPEAREASSKPAADSPAADPQAPLRDGEAIHGHDATPASHAVPAEADGQASETSLSHQPEQRPAPAQVLN